MQLKAYLPILGLFISISQAQQGVFNTQAPQTMPDSKPDDAPVHSPDYYNMLIANKNKQAYQSLVDATKASQNDPQLKALQEKALSNSDNQPPPLTTTNKTSAPQDATPPPQPNVIYQTPVTATKNNNNTATNFTSSASSTSNNNNSNSGSGSLDIQY